jgi:periplasmic divalent cation tolerance protein
MTAAEGEILIVFTNLPDRESALRLAHTLVERRLAACVNVLAGASSLYRWRGEIETAEEVPLIIKTRAALFSELEAAIVENHPYELPEIVAVAVVRGLPGYLDWVAAETSGTAP